jgi:uncharacterized membrane protein YjjB (DUF3815 family)
MGSSNRWPHLLNGAVDIISGRFDRRRTAAPRQPYCARGRDRITAWSVGSWRRYADRPLGRDITLWLDIAAAGVAVVSYGIFFSMPFKVMSWPVAVVILARAARRVAPMAFGLGLASGALVACITAGLILNAVARRSHAPFAAIGFTAVVSILPGGYIFKMLSGLVQIAGNTQTPSPVHGFCCPRRA